MTTPRALMLLSLLMLASQGDAQGTSDDAAAQAALPRAEIRTIQSEVRTITGLNGKVDGAERTITGEVAGITGAQRSLASSGLTTRMVNGGLEVSLPGDVLFDFDKATIRRSAIPTLERVRHAAGQTGTRPVRIDGYTDALGATSHNQSLSEARAGAVARWLEQAGISRARISRQGHGASTPVAPNTRPDGKDDPVGRQKNRRVTVTL